MEVNFKNEFTYQCKEFDGTMPCINWELYDELPYGLRIEWDELAEDSFLQLRGQPFRYNFYENFFSAEKETTSQYVDSVDRRGWQIWQFFWARWSQVRLRQNVCKFKLYVRVWVLN